MLAPGCQRSGSAFNRCQVGRCSGKLSIRRSSSSWPVAPSTSPCRVSRARERTARSRGSGFSWLPSASSAGTNGRASSGLSSAGTRTWSAAGCALQRTRSTIIRLSPNSRSSRSRAFRPHITEGASGMTLREDRPEHLTCHDVERKRRNRIGERIGCRRRPPAFAATRCRDRSDGRFPSLVGSVEDQRGFQRPLKNPGEKTSSPPYLAPSR